MKFNQSKEKAIAEELNDYEGYKYDIIEDILNIVEVTDPNDEDGLFEYLLKEHNLKMSDIENYKRSKK